MAEEDVDYQAPVAGEDASCEDSEASKKPSSILRKLTAFFLIIAAIIIYVYILYVVFAMLVYPGSLSPFVVARASPSRQENVSKEDNATKERDSELKRAILTDALLLCLFVVQHTLMACSAFKRVFEELGLQAVTRPLYACITCCVIQFIYQFWVPTPSYTVWECHNCIAHYVLIAVHVASWLSIACSLFTIDYLELLGLKQIYYSYHWSDNPMHYKSGEQQRLLAHMRHPIFLAPLLILWMVPVMSYDRVLVAVLLPFYLAWGSNIDNRDVSYVTQQFNMKRSQLLANGKLD